MRAYKIAYKEGYEIYFSELPYGNTWTSQIVSSVTTLLQHFKALNVVHAVTKPGLQKSLVKNELTISDSACIYIVACRDVTR
jgi:hypothetical protein